MTKKVLVGVVVGPPATASRFDFRDQSPKSHVVFRSDTIAKVLTDGIRARRDVSPVGMGPVHEVVKEGVDVHGVHPALWDRCE